MPISRVLVVDDHRLWRHLIIGALEQRGQISVIGEVADGLEAVRQAKDIHPDLITLDVGLPILNGIEAAKEIRVDCPHSKILFVSENRSPDIAEEAMKTGAAGYVVKSHAGSELLPAIEVVLQGGKFVSASLADRVFINVAIDKSEEWAT